MRQTIHTTTFLLLILLSSQSLFAQSTFTSQVTSGNWNSSGSWTENTNGNPADSDGIPDADDDVIIASGHTITLTVDAAANDVSIQGGSLYLQNPSPSTTNRNFNIGGNLDATNTSSLDADDNLNRQQVLVAGNFSVTSGTYPR